MPLSWTDTSWISWSQDVDLSSSLSIVVNRICKAATASFVSCSVSLFSSELRTRVADVIDHMAKVFICLKSVVCV